MTLTLPIQCEIRLTATHCVDTGNVDTGISSSGVAEAHEKTKQLARDLYDHLVSEAKKFSESYDSEISIEFPDGIIEQGGENLTIRARLD